MRKALLTLLLLVASASASAIGVAGVAARGGIHRHCDDACRYRLDMEAEHDYARSPQGRRESELAREREQRQYDELRAKNREIQLQPLADRMRNVNVLGAKP